MGVVSSNLIPVNPAVFMGGASGTGFPRLVGLETSSFISDGPSVKKTNNISIHNEQRNGFQAILYFVRVQLVGRHELLAVE